MSGGIIRVNKRGSKGYFVASNAPFNDTSLSWGARGLMGYLLSKPDGWETRNSDLLAKGPAGEHKIKRMLRELKDAGYMHRYRRNADGGLFEWVTEIYERPDLNPDYGATNQPEMAPEQTAVPEKEGDGAGSPPSGENHTMVDQQPSGDYPSMDEPSMDEPSVDNRPIYKIQNPLNTDQVNTDQTSSTTKANGQSGDVDGGLGEDFSLHPLSTSVLETAAAVADWMGFTGDITREMQQFALTPAALLAWAFWVKVEGERCRNPVGVCKSKWSRNGRRGPDLPPARWLDLARAWLDLDDNGRRELLATGGMSHMLSYEFPYPDVAAAFGDLYRATGGQPVPTAMLPDEVGEDEGDRELEQPDHEELGSASATEIAGESIPEVDKIWSLLVENQYNPGARMWLSSTKLMVDTQARTAVVVVVNSYAADWVSNRLLEHINREWSVLVRHVKEGSDWHDLRVTGAIEAAHLVAA